MPFLTGVTFTQPVRGHRAWEDGERLRRWGGGKNRREIGSDRARKRNTKRGRKAGVEAETSETERDKERDRGRQTQDSNGRQIRNQKWRRMQATEMGDKRWRCTGRQEREEE